MKLTRSIVAIATLTSMNFAGGMIMEPAYENETVVIPIEPIYVAPAVVKEVVEEVVPYVAPPKVDEPYVAPPVKEEVKKAPIVIDKVPPVKVIPPVAVAKSSFYVAGGLTDVGVRRNGKINLFGDEKTQDRQIGLTGRVGYDFMDYLGAELRGTYGIAKDKGSKFKQLGAYLKPNYDVTKEINLYGLFGASKTNVGVGSDTGFSYGAGLDYGISDKVSVFTDVVNYMKKSNTAAQWGLTLGAGYRF